MTKVTASCDLDTTLRDAIQSMERYGCGFLPVTGEGGNVVAVITDRDISIALGTRNERPSAVFVRDVVLPPGVRFPKLFTCAADADVRSALEAMRFAGVRRLPVVDIGGGLVGVLSLDELAVRACEGSRQRGIGCAYVVRTYQAIARSEGCAARAARTSGE
jgi:CBS domain-containing protein